MSLGKAFSFKKKDILRGYNSFPKLINNSRQFNSDNLRVYLQIKNQTNSDFESPLTECNIKAGFVVSKKIVSKSIKRNYLKRILKEAYRKNKNHYFKELTCLDFNLLFVFKKNDNFEINSIDYDTIEKELKEILFKTGQFLLRI